jgi:membrane protease YdiL (CAAX protease family)
MALPSILSQIYSTLLLLAIISLTIWLSLSKILSVYRQIPLPTAILDALGFFLFAAICFINCLFEDFLYRHTLSLVRTSLNKTVNFLEFTNRNNKQTIVKVLTYLATFVTFGFTIFTNKNVLGSKVFKYNLVGMFLTYRILLLVLCVYDAANAIQNRLVLLSHKIQKLVQLCNTQ